MSNTTNNHQIDLSKKIMYQFTNGGKVVVYNSINRTSTDFQRIISCALFFAEQGKQVILTPKFNSPLKNKHFITFLLNQLYIKTILKAREKRFPNIIFWIFWKDK